MLSNFLPANLIYIPYNKIQENILLYVLIYLILENEMFFLLQIKLSIVMHVHRFCAINRKCFQY